MMMVVLERVTRLQQQQRAGFGARRVSDAAKANGAGAVVSSAEEQVPAYSGDALALA
jgi:hypothetical protein